MKKTATKTITKAVKPAAKLSTKRVSTPGKFVYKPIVSTISLCKCGGKYVSTRKGQKTCLRCMFEN